MQIDVTTATRESEPLATTAASMVVITGDDIRRAGVTTIADALRLAGLLHVARINNEVWAISARGFNAPSANKLLVMIDGRTVYSPLFSGVFWNSVDYGLQDIDRIEIVRGAAATLWGANAVNGVVNIITRSSAATTGGSATADAGNEDAIAQVRYGGAAGAGSYRVYAKAARRDGQVLSTGVDADDANVRGQVGFRLDGAPGTSRGWFVKGDVFRSSGRFSELGPSRFTAIALHGGWTRLIGPSSLQVQSYYAREHRDVTSQLAHQIDTIDIDLQQAMPAGRHRLVWGAGARVESDDTRGGTVGFEPAARRYGRATAFIHDEYTLVPDRLAVIGGVRVEYGSIGGVYWHPDARVRVVVARGHTTWAAVSRAVRRPTRLDVDLRAFAPTGALTAIGGGEEFEGETARAIEAGYRAQIGQRLSLEAVAYRTAYDNLRSVEAPAAPGPARLANSIEATSSGAALTLTAQPAAWWRSTGGYIHQRIAARRSAGSRHLGAAAGDTNDPRHVFSWRNSFDLPGSIEADVAIRGAGRLPQPLVPGYTEADARIAWRPRPSLELALIGQDLLHASHPEFSPTASQPIREEVERSLRVRIGIEF